MELRQLQTQDYDQLIELLNTVFTRKNGRTADFEKDLPKMCYRDEEHMGQHFGVFEDGRLVSALGVYPLPAVIAGTPVMFSTVGNVATHWDYTGHGYMNLLLQRAMKELDTIQADASRLGGLRFRYSRFGYEPVGAQYHFSFSEHNRLHGLTEPGEISFSKIERGDVDLVAFTKKLNEQNGMYAFRSDANNYRAVYDSLAAWQNIPYIAKNEAGEPIGYLCASADGRQLAEANAVDDKAFADMISRWQMSVGASINFNLMPYEEGRVRIFAPVCESFSVTSPCRFYIRNYEKITDALLRLKASYMNLPEGSFVLGIEGYGSIRMHVTDTVGAELTEDSPELTVSAAQASRLLYGPFPASFTASVPGFVNAWLPLPLSWNLQDRV